MLKEYLRKGKVIEATLENEKKVLISSEFIDNMVKNLNIDEEEAVLTWLEDEEYIINDDQVELNQKAKENKANKIIKAKNENVKKTQRERVRKENPIKENIIKILAECLQTANYEDVVIENKGKIITFTFEGESYKIDLIQKRKKKN